LDMFGLPQSQAALACGDNDTQGWQGWSAHTFVTDL
jgi:hypothetical protein